VAIQYVGGTTGTGTGASYSVSLNGALTGGLASSPAAGDLIVVYAGHGNTASSAPTCSGNTSGAYVAAHTAIHSNDTWDTEFCTFYQFAGATPDTTLTIGRTNTTTYGGATVVLVFRDVSSVTATSTSGFNGGAVNPPSVTPTVAGSWVVAGGTGMLSATDTAGMTAISNLTAVRSAYGDGSTSDASTIAGYYSGWTSGAFDPAAATGGNLANTSSSWAASTLVLAPLNPSISTVTENFQGTRDTNKWYTDEPTGSTVTFTGGELVLTPAQTNGFGAILYSGAPGGFFDLDATGAYVKLTQRLTTANKAVGGYVEYDIFDNNDTTTYVGFQVSTAGVLKAITYKANVQTQSVTISSTWDTDNTPWLKITLSGGTVTWWTAPDSGSGTPGTWTSRNTNSTLPAQFHLAKLWYQTWNDDWTTTGALVGAAKFDGVNTAANSVGGGAVAGDLTAAESGADTHVSTGTVLVSGSLAPTEASTPDTFASTGAVKVTGALAATEDSAADTLAATGAVKVAGAQAVSETGSDTAAATGAVAVSGAFATAESGADTSQITGAVAVAGSLATTEAGDDTFAAGGGSPIAGSLGATEADTDTFGATGTAWYEGAMAASEPVGQDAFVSTGTLPIAGALVVTEPASDSLATTGTVAIAGSLAPTETGSDSLSSTAAVAVAGSLGVSETGDDAWATTGAVAVAGVLSGTETSPDTISAPGTVAVQGSTALVEAATDTATISGAVAVAGSSDLVETADAFAASGGPATAAAMNALESGADVYDALLDQSGNPVTDQNGNPIHSAVTGNVLVSGTLSPTEDADTFGAAGSLSRAGSVAIVESTSDTFTGAATVLVWGNLTTSESQQDSFAATGVLASQGSMTAAETGGDSLSAPGKVAIAGAAAATEASTKDSFSCTGIVFIAGAASAFEAADTFAATGRVPAVGSLSAGEAAISDSFGSTGSVWFEGAMAAAEAATLDSFEAFGVRELLSSLQAVETDSDSFAAAGVVPIRGAFSASEAADTFFCTGNFPSEGAMGAVESAGIDTVQISGRVAVRGAAAATEASDSDIFETTGGKVFMTGVMTATEQRDSFAADGSVWTEGFVTITEATRDSAQFTGSVLVLGASEALEQAIPDTFAGKGGPIVTGSLDCREEGADLFGLSEGYVTKSSVTPGFFFGSPF
jgi:hypothetical protein